MQSWGISGRERRFPALVLFSHHCRSSSHLRRDSWMRTTEIKAQGISFGCRMHRPLATFDQLISAHECCSSTVIYLLCGIMPTELAGPSKSCAVFVFRCNVEQYRKADLAWNTACRGWVFPAHPWASDCCLYVRQAGHFPRYGSRIPHGSISAV